MALGDQTWMVIPLDMRYLEVGDYIGGRHYISVFDMSEAQMVRNGEIRNGSDGIIFHLGRCKVVRGGQRGAARLAERLELAQNALNFETIENPTGVETGNEDP